MRTICTAVDEVDLFSAPRITQLIIGGLRGSPKQELGIEVINEEPNQSQSA